jgi:hypothetical protein
MVATFRGANTLLSLVSEFFIGMESASADKTVFGRKDTTNMQERIVRKTPGLRFVEFP